MAMSLDMILMGISMGLWLASVESEQYTALVYFPVRPIDLTMLVVLCVGVCMLGLWLLRRRRCAGPVPVLAMMACLQTLGSAGQFLSADGADGLLANYYLYSLLMKAAFVALFYEAALCVRRTGDVSGKGLVVAFAVSGIVQLLAVAFVKPVARALVVLLPLLACLCWCAAVRVGARRDEGNRVSASLDKPVLGTKSVVPMLACLFLMGALLISTYANRMAFQDGATSSMMIQIVGGVGKVAGSVALLLLISRPMGRTFASRLTLLVVAPLMLCVLYIASLFTGPEGLIFTATLHSVAYLLVYYLVWIVAAVPWGGLDMLGRFLLSFFATRLGWGVGVIFFLFIPAQGIGGVSEVISLLFLVVLEAISIFATYRLVSGGMSAAVAERGMGGADAAGEGGMNPGEGTGLPTRVDELAERFGLTGRERDVLACLAKGRNAAFIQKELSISEGTARTHINHIYQKCGVHGQQALMDMLDGATIPCGE